VPPEPDSDWRYFERRLGKPVERRVRMPDPRDLNTRSDDPREPRRPEDRSLTEWMETYSEAWTTRDVEPVPEANFLRSLSDNAFIVILGEPGSGKSWLAANMARTLSGAFLDSGWLERQPMPHAPVFARFRALKASRPGENVSAWDVIEDWSAEFSHPIRPPLPAQHRPVFILDGLDELRIDARASLARSLHDLPGTTILTCRTAVWESELRDKFTPAPTVYRLLGLNDQEQRRFLESRPLPDGTSASALLQRVRSNPSLRALAGNPLLLGLIAEEGANLPANRAELYASTIRKRWRELEEKRLIDSERTLKPNELLRLEPIRDRFLAKLAEGLVQASDDTPKANIRTVFTWLDLNRVAETLGLPEERLNLLVDALLTTGLLTREGETGYAFIHPTFQEHALARAWLFPDGDEQNVSLQSLERRMTEVIQDHWLQVEFEETLALALSMAVYKGVNPLEPIRGLVEQTRVSIDEMWERKRSALRTALHILTRSTIETETALVNYLTLNIKGGLRRFAVASDENTPTSILLNIVKEDGLAIISSREKLNKPADDLASTIEKLLYLSSINLKDIDSLDILNQVAKNPNSGEFILDKLMKLDDSGLNVNIAGNPNTSIKILDQLLKVSSKEIRENISKNRNATESMLFGLFNFVSSENSLIYNLATNPNSTEIILLELIKHDRSWKIDSIKRHPNATENVLLELSKNIDSRSDKTLDVKIKLENSSDISKEDELTDDQEAVMNPNTSPEKLFELVKCNDFTMNNWIASHKMANEAVLLWFFENDDSYSRSLRYNASMHPNATKTVLTRAVNSDDKILRITGATNPNMILESLSNLPSESQESTPGKKPTKVSLWLTPKHFLTRITSILSGLIRR
jgi:NACHT domain